MRLRRKLFSCVLLALLLLAVPVSAEVKDVSATGTYIAGASESLNDAKQHAREDAMRIATEQAGVLVSSYSKTQNMTLSEDEVSTIASKIIGLQSVDYKITLISDSEIKVIAEIRARIDSDSIHDDILKLKEENTKLKNQTKTQQYELDVMKQAEDLEEELEKKYYRPLNLKNPIRKNIRLTINSTWQECVEQFYNDMSVKNFYAAGGDCAAAETAYLRSKGNKIWDSQICEIHLMQIERLVLNNDRSLALRLLYTMKRDIKEGKMEKISDVTLRKIERYYGILYRYMMKYHPEWQKSVYYPLTKDPWGKN